MPYTTVSDFTMFYTDEGSGPPLLFVHGFSCDGNDWSWQIPAFTPTNRVITVDLRGHGHSSAPNDGYTFSGFATDVAELLTQLNTGPVVAMGHSMGGGVVAALAAARPDLVRALVLVDSALGMEATNRPAIDQLLAGLNSPACHDIVAAFFAGSFYPPASPPHLAAMHARRLRAVPQHVLAKSMAGLFEVDGIAFREGSEACLQALQVPYLTFRAGKQDPSAVAAWERAQSSNHYSKAVTWEGTGHFLHQERPAEFNAITTEWIAGLP